MKTFRVSATVLSLAMTAGLLGACSSLSEEDRNFLNSVRSDSQAAADNAARSADSAEAAARRAEAAAQRAEEAAARAEAMFNRGLRK